jgi:hypothetical protein
MKTHLLSTTATLAVVFSHPALCVNASVCPSVRLSQLKGFQNFENNRKKAGPFSVGTTVAPSDR